MVSEASRGGACQDSIMLSASRTEWAVPMLLAVG